MVMWRNSWRPNWLKPYAKCWRVNQRARMLKSAGTSEGPALFHAGKRLRLIQVFRLARHVHAHGQHVATQRVVGEFGGGTVVAGAGDIQRAQVGAAKGQHGGAAHGHGDFTEQMAIGGEA